MNTQVRAHREINSKAEDNHEVENAALKADFRKCALYVVCSVKKNEEPEAEWTEDGAPGLVEVEEEDA